MTNTITIPNIDGVELNILSELKINQLEDMLVRCYCMACIAYV